MSGLPWGRFELRPAPTRKHAGPDPHDDRTPLPYAARTHVTERSPPSKTKEHLRAEEERDDAQARSERAEAGELRERVARADADARADVAEGRVARAEERLAIAEAGELRERSARADADARTLARDEMLAAVSHDLKTPLNAVLLSAAAILSRVPVDSSLADFARKIRRSAERMDKLLRDLIDTATLDAEAVRLSLCSCDVDALARQIVDDHHLSAIERRVELRYTPSEMPALALGDESRLAQVFDNLVSNAVKFTHAGGRVVVSVARIDRVVRFEVEDTGPGLTADELKHIFERRWQADAHSKIGSGLGLFIARGLVQAHGGRIVAQSVVGRGTTFRVDLVAEPFG